MSPIFKQKSLCSRIMSLTYFLLTQQSRAYLRLLDLTHRYGYWFDLLNWELCVRYGGTIFQKYYKEKPHLNQLHPKSRDSALIVQIKLDASHSEGDLFISNCYHLIQSNHKEFYSSNSSFFKSELWILKSEIRVANRFGASI